MQTGRGWLIELYFFIIRYMRLPIKEAEGLMIENSDARMEVLENLPAPVGKHDVINMLGDQSGTNYWVFQDYDEFGPPLTLAVGKKEKQTLKSFYAFF